MRAASGLRLVCGTSMVWPYILHTNASVENAMAHPYYGTAYMGTDGRWNGANSPIGPWQHGYEGGAERGYRTPSIALIA